MRCLGLSALILPALGLAGTAHGTGSGGPIPSGAFVTSGAVTSDIVLTDTGKVAAGNAVTVNLLGLQHDFAGDLRITLSYIDSTGATVQSVDLVNRVGASNASPNGTAADYGNGQGSGDNYQFNSDYTGDIWAAAACSDPPACTTPYGDADSIPGVSTDTIHNGQYFSSTTGGAKTNLSYAFSGLNVNGTWRLTITDAADPNAGSYIGWEIFVTTAGLPTPHTITAIAGTPQSATVSAAFAAALQAKVTDSLSNPVAGVTVTFAAPASGASATFGGASSATAVTNAAGTATSPVPVANSASGGYTITASVTGLTPANFSLTNTAAAPTTSAIFQKTDTTTLGNWKSVYGTDGSLIPNDSSHVPSYAAVNFSSALTYTWLGSTTDSRGLLKYSSSTDRIASTYYSYGFTIDANLTDGKTHQIALYIDDWDSGGRAQTISFVDANTNVVLDTRSAATFVAGRYLVWQVKGHVLIQVAWQSGYNALVNGIFFDPISSVTTTPPTVSLTAPAAGASVSGLVTVSAQAQSSIGISQVQFLLDGNSLGSPVTGAGPTYSTSWASSVAVNGSHTLAAVATDTQGHSTTSAPIAVTLSNGGGNTASATFQKVDTTTLGNWKGVYGADGSLIPNESSHVPSYATVNLSNALTYTWLGSTTDSRGLLKYSSSTDRIASTYYGYGFTIDANLTDGQTHQIALYIDDWDNGGRAQTISFVDANTNAVLDTRSAANFVAGRYLVWQVKGRVLIQVAWQSGYNALVNGIFFDPISSSTTTPPTVSVTAPAAGATVSGSVTITAQAQSSVGIASVQFLLDGNSLGQPVTGSGPTYSTTWASGGTANGSHTLAAIATDTQGHSTTSASIAVTLSNSTGGAASATFQKVDTATLGNWKGAYGTDGSLIPSDSSHIPGYATVSVNNALLYTWTGSTADTRALLKYASTTDRLASTYYSFSSLTIDVNFTDGQAHQVALYVLDWDGGNRAESISIVDATANTALDTRTASNFTAGRYLVWKIQGHVLIQVTLQGGSNALVNGIFFDPAH